MHRQTDTQTVLVPDTTCSQLLALLVLPCMSCSDLGSLRDPWSLCFRLGSKNQDESSLEFNMHMNPLGSC